MSLFSKYIFTVSDQADKNLPNCNARYGGMDNPSLISELQQFANLHIMRSFEYLLVSTHFANYVNNREGFEKMFRKLSDSTWEDGIDVIKHIGMRGGNHSFAQRPIEKLVKKEHMYEQYELQSLGRAVDVQKHLADEAFQIHNTALRRHRDTHDPEIAQYIEEKFAEKHAEEVRTLVGHVSDLRRMSQGKDVSLALHLFDQYLAKA